MPSTSKSLTTSTKNEFLNDASALEKMDRKIKKPLMEKQRRDRMNKSMEDLKVIIIRHDPNHTSKLEKADILEKT
uniref:BHLH domain-containing protein n=1 Tax=Panagrolaimus sp. ES5 TaxID=591445 RepID=A0AC34FMN9_9BILA